MKVWTVLINHAGEQAYVDLYETKEEAHSAAVDEIAYDGGSYINDESPTCCVYGNSWGSEATVNEFDIEEVDSAQA